MNLRRARPEDAQAIARLLRRAFRISLPFLPDLHTAEDDLWFVRERMLVVDEVWLAEDADQVLLGFVAFREGWIDHLYVDPDHQGQGIGPILLAKPMRLRQTRRLWTFQQNERARRFYEARGFKPIEFTDGSANEEKEPDVLYEWRPQ